MSTFARVVDGHASDVQVCADKQEILKRYPFEQIEEWGGLDAFIQVPDGTEHGAKSDGNGGWVNPTHPTPTPQPVPLTKEQFESLYAANGADITKTLAAWPTA